MCNEKEHTHRTNNNQQLLFYRLDQLEENQRKDTEAIMTTLQVIQEGINDSNKTLLLHTEQITQLRTELAKKVDIKNYDSDKESLKQRLDVYKRIFMGVGIAVGGAILMELIKVI